MSIKFVKAAAIALAGTLTFAATQVLHTGFNTLAVGVWNNAPVAGFSSDLVLVPQLSLRKSPQMTYRANAADPGIGLDWTTAEHDDSAWASGHYGVGYEAGVGAESDLEQEPEHQGVDGEHEHRLQQQPVPLPGEYPPGELPRSALPAGQAGVCGADRAGVF